MRVAQRDPIWIANLLAVFLTACGTSPEDASQGEDDGSVTTSTTSTGSTTSAGATTQSPPSSSSTATATGANATTGTNSATSDSGGTGGQSASSDGAPTDSSTTSGGGSDAGATTTTAATTTTGGGDGCVVGAWPAADPALPGPFAVVTEENVGPAVGVGENDEPVPFTLFRPETLGESGLCHPVVTWGNGTGSEPSLYGILLRHLASHGFVVIASNSPNVADGDPPPMVAGVTWVLEQNADPASALYGHIDATHVGATGHSQGGFATTAAAGDSQITTIAPLCGASNPRNLHGPALLLCGGQDETVPCDESIQNAFDATNEQPVMLANYLTADHANWVTFFGDEISPMETAVTAWMRVQLMGDTSLRPWFYGADCQLCTDSAWAISRKMMDE